MHSAPALLQSVHSAPRFTAVSAFCTPLYCSQCILHPALLHSVHVSFSHDYIFRRAVRGAEIPKFLCNFPVLLQPHCLLKGRIGPDHRHFHTMTHLATCTMLLAPCGHHKGIIDRDAGYLLHPLAPQLYRLLHEPRQVCLRGGVDGGAQQNKRKRRAREFYSSVRFIVLLSGTGRYELT